MKKTVVKNNVRYLRRKADLTQEELADQVGVHRQTIISIEKQKYEPKIGVVLAIASIVNEPVEEVFFLQ